MGKKKSSEWRKFIEKYNKPLGKERYVQLAIDHETGMSYIVFGGEMATKEVTTKNILELLKLVNLPDDVYNVVKNRQDRIIREREINQIRKSHEKSKLEASDKKEGYVYFLKEYHGNTVKIGYAKNPRDRINQMMFVPSIPVEIILTIRSTNAQRMEYMFHKLFYKKRIKNGYRTEFFDLTEADMKDIYNRNLPEEILNLIVEEDYEPLPLLMRKKRRVQIEQSEKGDISLNDFKW